MWTRGGTVDGIADVGTALWQLQLCTAVHGTGAAHASSDQRPDPWLADRWLFTVPEYSNYSLKTNNCLCTAGLQILTH
jgi:hypothetical protein